MARPKYPSDDSDKTMVRFPPGLMPKIKEAAAASGRSMNAEIVHRLQSTFVGIATSDAEFEKAFSGQTPFEAAVGKKAAEVLALSFQMALKRLEETNVITKDIADEVRADQKARRSSLSDISADKKSLSTIKSPSSD